jgi:hypothetical protein
MQIQLSNAALDVIVFENWDAYKKIEREFTLYQPPPLSPDYTADDYQNDKGYCEDELKAALSKYWISGGEDFEVGFDGNYALSSCGGIYSRRIICRDYLQIVRDILQGTKTPDLWLYDTSIELTEESGMGPSFIIQGNKIFLDGDPTCIPPGFDFVKLFSRTRSQAASE